MKRFKAQASKPELRKVAYSSGNLAVNLLSKYRRSIKKRQGREELHSARLAVIILSRIHVIQRLYFSLLQQFFHIGNV